VHVLYYFNLNSIGITIVKHPRQVFEWCAI